MYEYLISLLIKDYRKQNKVLTGKRLDEVYLSLIYILYLSNKKETKTKIKELLEEENNDLLVKYLTEEEHFHIYYLPYIDVKKYLKIIKGQSYQELLEEFLKIKEDPDNKKLDAFLHKKDRILYINTTDDIASYDYANFNVTYLQETIDNHYYSNYNCYFILDKMLKLKRNYYRKLSDLNLNDYDIVIINDTEPFYKYSANKESFMKEIEQKFYFDNHFQGRIVLKTNYNKISHFKYFTLVRRHLSKVILHAYVKNVTVYMEFLSDSNKSISLILLDDELAADPTKLQKIIESNRNKKGTLIKVTPEDIQKNNYRISFKMYDTENIEKVKVINDIVDENTELTKRLESLNTIIESEVNKLLERTGG